MNTQSLLQPNINYNESTADEFSVTKAYSTGNYCIYNNILYKFTSDKAAGAWDSSKVTSTTVAGELSSLNTNIADTHIIAGTDCSIRYTEVNATLVIIKGGANLTGGNTSNQVIVTLPDGVKIQNEALLGKPAPVLDSSWVPTGDYVTLGTSDEKNITGRTLNNHTNCVVVFSTTFPRQYLQLS